MRELPDGFAFRFEAQHYASITDFIANERRCCPFFAFGLDVAPSEGPIWLRVTGSGTAKDIIRSLLASADSHPTITME